MNKPNFLIIMSDEHSAQYSSVYGHPIIKTPNMDKMAKKGATFTNNVCNSPLCVPSRASFMTGQYVSNNEVWDNTKPMPSDKITWPYILRNNGYEAVLSGKMHLIGVDNLHGFERNLSYDPHIDEPLPHYSWEEGITKASKPWNHINEAREGTSPMIEADNKIEKESISFLSDKNRNKNPFALCVGFIAPHFPFIVPEKYFNEYFPDNIIMPDPPPGHLNQLSNHSKRLREMFGLDYNWNEIQIRKSIAAYYGLCTFLDEKIGNLINALKENNLFDNTIIIYTSDHGDMLGEHGLWRKMSFYDQSVRVPLQIIGPKFISGQVDKPVSNLDLFPTILDAANIDLDQYEYDGQSLINVLTTGNEDSLDDYVISEYFAHGTENPIGMVQKNEWKLIYEHDKNPKVELFNLNKDPHEYNNLSPNPEYHKIIKELSGKLINLWGDPEKLRKKIIYDQNSRKIIRKFAGTGNFF